jgi:quinol-cytochrome oxidoreductase complex cytochrome b subunit
MGLSENRDRRSYWATSYIFHLRPRKVFSSQLKFTFTWGLGGMAAVLIVLLFGSGLLLKLSYKPFIDTAYESILTIRNELPFGQLIRNVHHWSGNFLIIVVFLHFLRVYFTGAYTEPRRLNWIIGFMLFVSVLISNFTGYLLPWDQLAFWAVTICTRMLEYVPIAGSGLQYFICGGNEVGPKTLANFYAIHTAVLPMILVLLLPFHFWRIRKAGGLVVPRLQNKQPEAEDRRIPAIPNLIVRELAVTMVLIAVVLGVSIFFNAPLQDKANPGLSPNPIKAPWYFAGLQELLLHFHPLFSIFIIPLVVSLGLASIPFIPYPKDSSGVWFISSKGRRSGLFAIAMAVLLTPAFIVVSEFMEPGVWLNWMPLWISSGILPLSILVGFLVLFYFIIKKRVGSDRKEEIQSVFIFLLSAFIILTVTGVWFRGAGMVLIHPW